LLSLIASKRERDLGACGGSLLAGNIGETINADSIRPEEHRRCDPDKDSCLCRRDKTYFVHLFECKLNNNSVGGDFVA